MIFRLFIIISCLLADISNITAREPLKYQTPPDDIVKIVDAAQTPGVSVSPDKSRIILSERSGLITIEELSAPELKLAGLRINPATNGPSRQTYFKNFRIMNIDGADIREITELPDNPRLGFPVWSGDGKKFAFTNTKSTSIELVGL